MDREQLKPNVILRGPIFPEPVQVLVALPLGDAIKVIAKGLRTGQVHEPVLNDKQLARLEASPEKEPFENGIHPARIQLVADYLKTQAQQPESQLIVTTHSPLLLDMMPDDSLLVFRKRDSRTLIEPYSGPGELFRPGEIRDALDAEDEKLPVSARILRGDFDA
jgi:hypothetical protein